MKSYKKISLLAVIASSLYACSGNHKPVDLTETNTKTKKSSQLELATVSEKSLSSAVRLPGQLKPFNEVNLFPKVNGFVKEVLVDRGSVVHQGQLLIKLEAPEMQAQVQAATSRYLQAQENAQASSEKYQRLKEAAKEPGSVSQLDLDNALAKMKADAALASSERSNVASVHALQGYLNIYAPFDGMIIQRNVSPGALVSPGKAGDQPMLILQDTRKMRLEVYIPEDYVDKVDLKRSVKYTFNAMPDQPFTGKISRSANALGSMRSEAIEIDVLNTKQLFKPGMYAEVEIPMVSGAKSMLVPNNAIIRSTEREYVVVARDGKASLIDVKEGLTTHDSTEVFGNLKPNEHVVINAGDEIKEGDKIN